MSPHRKALMSKKISDTLKLRYASMTLEEKVLFAEKRKKALTPEVKERIANKVSIYLQNNPEAIENLRIKGGNASRKYHSTKSEMERNRRAKAISKGVTKQWASYTDKQRRQHILNSLKGIAIRPTKPEIIVGDYLEEHFSGEWKYNGDCSCNVIIGGKIPDFININGKKAVIEVFGRYWHDTTRHPKRLSAEKLKAHYAKFGFDCIVIWEDECNNLDRIFSNYKVKV